MVLRAVTGAMLAFAIAASPALACKGDVEIYSDDFANADGPWETTEGVTLGKGFAELKPEPGKAAWRFTRPGSSRNSTRVLISPTRRPSPPMPMQSGPS